MLLHARLLRKFAFFVFFTIFKTLVCFHLNVICITESKHYTIHLVSTFVLNSLVFIFTKIQFKLGYAKTFYKTVVYYL